MNDRFGQDRDPTGGEAMAAAATVGDLLRAERQRRGWTLADAEIYLKIRRSMLEAIEQGRFELLPGRAYAMAFARTYAEFLGLNAEDVVARCREELRHVGEPEAGAGAGAGILGDIDLPRIGMAAAAVVAVILGGLWMFDGGSGDSANRRVDAQAPQVLPPRDGVDGPRLAASQAPAVPSGPGIAAAMPPPPPPQPPAAAPARPPVTGSTDPTAAQASPFPASAQQSAAAGAVRGAPPPAQAPASRITLKANGDTWIEIRDQAGASVLARTLRNGEVYNVPDRPGLVLSSGRITTIEVRVDGQVVPAQGRPARREMTLDPSRLLQNAQAVGAQPVTPAAAQPAVSEPAVAPPAQPTPPPAQPATRQQRRGNAPQHGAPANGAAPASPGTTGN
jgi:cytoskeleton protein RodZ